MAGQEYKARPCQIEGIETATDGDQRAQPTLSVANPIVPLRRCVLLTMTCCRQRSRFADTLAQYLDAKTIRRATCQRSAAGKLKVFYIDAKSTETNEVVAFTLSSPMDLQGLMIPTRQLHSLCTGVSRNKYRSGDG